MPAARDEGTRVSRRQSARRQSDAAPVLQIDRVRYASATVSRQPASRPGGITAPQPGATASRPSGQRARVGSDGPICRTGAASD